MKSKVIFMVIFLIAFGFLFSVSQAEEQKSELFLIEDEIVKPSKIADLEAALKEMVAYSTQHKYPYPWYTYSDDNYHYYYVMPIKDYADITNIFKTWAELGEKVGDPWQAMMKKYLKAYEYVKLGVIRTRADLSYVPENPRLKSGEEVYIRWGFCYVQPDKVGEFEEIMKEWVALFKKKNIADGFDTFIGDLGTDMPFYFWAEYGKSPADFFSHSEKNMEIFGDEAMKLWMRTLALLRQFENIGGMFRPELSYMPK